MGEKVENPKHLTKTEQRIKKLQKQFSRKKKGSSRYKTLARRIAKLHEKVKNQRRDFLHKLSKQIIGDNQAKLYGRVLIKMDTFFPSSKLCSMCGFKKEDLKLSEREWECPECKTKHDRDYNATLNLLKEGLIHLKRVVGVDCPELMSVEGGSPSMN